MIIQKGDLLNHIERKVKQIIQNIQITKGRNPTIEELVKWTGRDKKDLLAILRRLNKI
jgi:DNA-directed RNA polymerase specialized sigma subunit